MHVGPGRRQANVQSVMTDGVRRGFAAHGTNAFRESDALRRVFEGVVAKCIAAGLVGGREIFIDGA